MSNETQEQEVQHVGHGTEKSAGGGAGPYLRLKRKGDKARIRMVSDPIRYKKTFNNKTSDKFACKVIYKEAGSDGKVIKSVKGFEYGWLVYDAVRDLCNDPDWGDPINYDLEITRTEESISNFYSIIPKPAKPLTDEDKELVASTDINLVEMYTKQDGQQPAPAASDDYDPFAEE